MLKIIKKKHLKYKHQAFFLATKSFFKENFRNEQYKNNIESENLFL